MIHLRKLTIKLTDNLEIILKEMFFMSLWEMHETLDVYEGIYNQLRGAFRWQVSDHKLFMMVAGSYATSDKVFDLNRYEELTNMIKKEASLFSPLRSYPRFMIASLLDQRFEDPHTKIEDLVHIYDAFVKRGFKRGTFTYLSALIVLTETGVSTAPDTIIEKAWHIYKAMKSNHPFITSDNDYPLAVLLAELNEDAETLMNRVEDYYLKLHQQGLRKGNDLQFMCHILSLDETTPSDTYISDSLAILDSLKHRGFKLKSMHYPELALLAIINASQADLDLVHSLSETLNHKKAFRWHKDINRLLAINFIARHKMTENTLPQTGLYTTMETILQAQQTAMMAAMISGAVIVSSSSNN
jgi:hypothetical protein